MPCGDYACAKSFDCLLLAQVSLSSVYSTATNSNFKGDELAGRGRSGVKLSESGTGMAGAPPAAPFRCPHGDAEGVPGWPRGRGRANPSQPAGQSESAGGPIRVSRRANPSQPAGQSESAGIYTHPQSVRLRLCMCGDAGCVGTDIWARPSNYETAASSQR